MTRGSVLMNGINGSTGKYLAALSRRDLEEIVHRQGSPTTAPSPDSVIVRCPVPGVEPEKLETSGWGVVFPGTAEDDPRRALMEPLFEHRRAQVTRQFPHFYQEYTGERGVRPGESAHAWLVRQGAGPGGADPHWVPYYLLLVGSPEEISFEFQYQLGVEYAVGRLCFDHLGNHAQYAANVLAVEDGHIPPRPRRATFFCVDNPDDPATTYSSQYLMQPLRGDLRSRLDDWEMWDIGGEEATKARLRHVLHHDLNHAGPPALLFTTSHGMGFEADDPRLRDDFGALLCRDWPGPRQWRGRIPPEHYFAAADVAEDTDLRGLVTFHFACFSAGIPALDSFVHEPDVEARTLSPRDHLARLPQKLLGKPAGALAVIGHVDRARGFSFVWPGAGGQPQTLRAVLQLLMEGCPVGAAMRPLGTRYSHLCAELAHRWLRMRRGETVRKRELTDLWTAMIDARSYMVLGDPAVRLGPWGSALQ